MTKKVLSFPEDSNPYQHLLHNELRKLEYQVLFPKFWTKSQTLNLIELFPLVFIYRIKGCDIFHLHWLYKFQLPFSNVLTQSYAFRFLYSLYLVFFILWLKVLNYKVVWTIHNLIPHDLHFANDFWITKFLLRFSDAQIVHSNAVLQQMNKLGAYTKNVFVIPHGNYKSVYDRKNKQTVDTKLKKSAGGFVFLFFGNIKAYKGVEDFISIFNELNKTHKHIKFIIAGECNDQRLLNHILAEQKNNSNIICHIGHIMDDDVLPLFYSANMVVFPFKRITTSGSILLALTLGKPIVVPKIDAISEIPSETGIFYQNNEELILKLNEVIKNQQSLKTMSQAAINYSSELNWDSIAKKTSDLYQSLFK